LDFGIRRPRKQGFSRAPIWMTIYADMMTTLMLFFLMLYAMTRLDLNAETRKDFQQALGKEVMGRDQYSTAEVERHKMTDEEIAKEASKIKGFMQTDETSIKLSLQGEVLFDSGSSELKESASESMKQTLDIIAKISNKVIVEGYTDDVPIFTSQYKSNWELSLARAESVVNYLTANGVARGRICLAGYGEFKPLVLNKDTASRARNRRIEISIIKKNE
jgi:chemotaxis protein MotB